MVKGEEVTVNSTSDINNLLNQFGTLSIKTKDKKEHVDSLTINEEEASKDKDNKEVDSSAQPLIGFVPASDTENSTKSENIESLVVETKKVSLEDEVSDSDNESVSDKDSNDDKKYSVGVSDEDNEIKYLTRGIVSDNKHRTNRYKPFPVQNANTGNVQYNFHSSPTHGNSSPNGLFDRIEFNQIGLNDNSSYGVHQSGNSYNINDTYGNSQMGSNSLNSSPYYTPNYQQNYGNGFSGNYQLEEQNSYGVVGEGDNLKDPEDLINIINTINDSSKTDLDSNAIPEMEFLKLKNVLEGKEESIRTEMSAYLKQEQQGLQPGFEPFTPERENSDPNLQSHFLYVDPLTPPKSVSPVEDILQGITEINPDELNIYLKGNDMEMDRCLARNLLQARCNPSNLDLSFRKLSTTTSRTICRKDEEGDTCLMIVFCRREDSDSFYENIFCLQEKAIEIKVCCDQAVGKAKRCKVCGNKDQTTFYTPLSFKNKSGDTVLSCALKMKLSPLVINYHLQGLLKCQQDIDRVFDADGREMLAEFIPQAPCLMQFL